MGRVVNDCEKEYLRKVIHERACYGGEQVRFYSMLDRHTDDADSFSPYHDPLYDEPLSDEISGDEKFRFKGPYLIDARVKKGSSDKVVDERGTKTEVTDGIAYFPEQTFIDNPSYPRPKQGDIVEWEGRYYDVLISKNEGMIGTTLTNTEIKLELKINRAYAPERRLDASVDLVAP